MSSLDFSHAPPWLQWVISALAFLAFIGACLGLIKGIPAAWRVLSQFVKTMDALSGLPRELDDAREFRESTDERLTSQDAQLTAIKKEVLPNGGGSMRDDVTKTKTDVAEIKNKLSSDNIRIETLEKALELLQKGKTE